MTVKTIKIGSTTHDIQAGSADKLNTNAGSATSPVYFANGVPVECTYDLNKTVPSNAVFTDTKNTAGSTNSSSKLFLIGATSQAANPQTYSHDTAYVGTDGCLYSGSKKVLNDDRLFTTLVPTGTLIPANADLNTVTYLKVGRYYCSSNANTQTLANCPATDAFMMEVYSPLATTIDNETTKTWCYRLRKLMTYTGTEYIQYCYAGATAGVWTYGAWNKTYSEKHFAASANYTSGTKIGSITIDGDTTNYYVPLSNGTGTAGLIKTTSTITDVSAGYNACPVINGVPYYADVHMVQQNKSTSSVSSPILLGAGPDGIRTITTFSNGVTVTPSTNTITATTFSGTATNANKVKNNLAIKLNSGTTEGTNLFTFNGSAAKTVNITPSAIGAATAAQGTLATNAMPKTGGTFTGNVTYNTATFFKNSTYMANNVGYKAYDTSGNACILLSLNSSDNLQIGALSSSYSHPGDTIINSLNGIIKLNACTECSDNIIVPNATSYSGYGPTDDSGAFYRRTLLFISKSDNIHIGSDAEGSTTSSCHQGNTYINARKGNIYLVNGADTITFGLYTDTSTVTSFFRPATSGTVALGSSDHAWYQVATDRLYVYEGRITCKPTYENTVSAAANMYCGTGGVYSRTTNTSSRTIKHDIDELKNEDLLAENLYDLPIHQFKYNEGIITDEDDVRYMQDLPGFIIEEMDEIYPIAVDKPSDDVKEWSWNAQYLIPPILKLVQNQHKEIELSQNEIQKLQSTIEEQETEINDLKERIAKLEELLLNK